MWIRYVIGVAFSSYGGAVIATYGILALIDSSLSDPNLRFFPFHFAPAVMTFTFPGAIMVGGMFNMLRHKGYSRFFAFALTEGAAVSIGGLLLALFFPSLGTMAVGAFYGATTAAVWLVVDTLLGKALRSRADTK